VVPGVSAYVGVQVTHEVGRVVAKVEFNPSRIADPEGCSLAPAALVRGMVGQVVSAASEYVRPGDGDASAFRVKRIDVARDFEAVESPSALIRGLAPVPRPWSRRNLVHADPARNGAQTLMVGSGQGVVRLYDKAAETKGKVAVGTLRWEAENRASWAEKYGAIRTVEDICTESVGELALNRFDWSAMGIEVSSTHGVVEVLARSDLTDRERTMFLGWLVQQSTPYAWEPSSATGAKFRRLQRQLGVAVGPEAVASVGFVSRLDWESGREVVRVA
jgi:hypothetical protein